MTLRQVKGLWIPGQDPANYVETAKVINGLPCYQHYQVQAAIKACGDRRGTVIDGGAHVGLLALQFAHRFSRVMCFEPIAQNYEGLVLNTKDVPNIERHNIALSDHEGTLDFRQEWTTKSFGWTSLGKSEVKATAPCHRLDTFNLDNVDLIKLDLEGHELQAIQGALETIKRCKPVLLIEDKHIEGRPARQFLHDLGMREGYTYSYDSVFSWPT